MSPINFSINEAHYSLNENEMSSPVGSSDFFLERTSGLIYPSFSFSRFCANHTLIKDYCRIKDYGHQCSGLIARIKDYRREAAGINAGLRIIGRPLILLLLGANSDASFSPARAGETI